MIGARRHVGFAAVGLVLVTIFESIGTAALCFPSGL
jgi:hypothetical protein